MSAEFRIPPYAHQRVEFDRFSDALAHARFWEMGTGKTAATINEICHAAIQKRINGALIVAPKGMYHQWCETNLGDGRPAIPRTEWDKFAWDTVHGRTVTYLWTAATRKRDVLVQVGMSRPPKNALLHLVVMNVESMATKRGQAFADAFVSSHKAFVVVDESSTIKNPRAKRTKALWKIGDKAKMRRVLTGTPITNSPFDAFAQMRFLNKSIFPGGYWAFRSRYGVFESIYVSRDRKIDTVVGYRRMDELRRIVGQHSSRVTKDECLDLPAVTYMMRFVDLGPTQRKVYDSLRYSMLAELEDKVVTAPLMLTCLLRMRQVLAGFTRPDGGDETDLDPRNTLIDEVLDAVEESEGKLVLWAHFQRTVRQMSAALRKVYGDESVVEYFGGDGADTAGRIEKQNAFLDPSGPVRFFVGTPDTGKWGLNLIHKDLVAHTMFYLNNSHSLDTRLQSEARLNRIGQTRPMTVVDFVHRGTVDENILDALLKKKNIADQVTGDEFKAWLAGETPAAEQKDWRPCDP